MNEKLCVSLKIKDSSIEWDCRKVSCGLVHIIIYADTAANAAAAMAKGFWIASSLLFFFTPSYLTSLLSSLTPPQLSVLINADTLFLRITLFFHIVLFNVLFNALIPWFVIGLLVGVLYL